TTPCAPAAARAGQYAQLCFPFAPLRKRSLPAAASPDLEMPPVPQPAAKNATASATPASAIRLNLGGRLGTVELLDGLDTGGIDGEDPVEAGDLEDLGDVAVTADEQQLAAVRPQPLDAADQHAEGRRVDERGLREVDDHLPCTVSDHLKQLLLEVGRRVE